MNSRGAAAYMELALQTHQMLCHGRVNFSCAPTGDPAHPESYPPKTHIESLAAFLNKEKGKMLRGQQPAEGLLGRPNAAEFTVLSQNTPQAVECHLSVFAGQSVRSEMGKRIHAEGDMTAAAKLVRECDPTRSRQHCQRNKPTPRGSVCCPFRLLSPESAHTRLEKLVR